MGATICFFDDMIKDLESVEPSKVCDYISEILMFVCVLNPFVQREKIEELFKKAKDEMMNEDPSLRPEMKECLKWDVFSEFN